MHLTSNSPTLVLAATVITVLIGVLAVAPSNAHADIVLGAETSYATPSGDWAQNASGGAGLQLRLGYALPVPGIRLVPELIGMRQGFGSATDSSQGDAIGYSAFIGAAGLRVGLAGPISPVIFGHIGVGQLEGEAAGFTTQEDGSYYDLGAAIDFTVLPLINVGVHGSYHELNYDTTLNPGLPTENSWYSFGAHLEVVF